MVICPLCSKGESSPGIPLCTCQWDQEAEFYAASRRNEVRRKVREDFTRTVPPRYQNYLAREVPDAVCRANPEMTEYMTGTFGLGSFVFLHGPAGRGKTHAGLHHVGRLVRDLDVTGAYVSELQYFDGLTQGMRGGQTEMADLRLTKVLLYDDFGRRKASEWVRQEIFALMEFRWSHKLATVITTNYDPDTAGGQLSDDVRDVEALVSRMTSGETFTVVGPIDGRVGSAK